MSLARRRSRMRVALAAALAALTGLAGAGCGAASDAGPRDALRSLLAALASGNVAGACSDLTVAGSAELRPGFGGGTCAATLTTAVDYVRARAGEQAAVGRARVLPAVDVPLSPAPYRSGSSTASLRVSFDDPVLGAEQQEFDVGLRLTAGRWQVDSGIAALFTLLGPGSRQIRFSDGRPGAA
jgi:hypothetical protein